MSSHIVEVCYIADVVKHPNADRLDIVTIKGWQCVAGRGEFKQGYPCIYIPIDSVLPDKLASVLFPADSKVKLTNNRIKTIKLRGAISQGMAIRPEVVGLDPGFVRVGMDVAAILGITKYEPPAPKANALSVKGPRPRVGNHNFHKYTDIENFKNYNNTFVEGEEVVITEKIHGTNFRAGWVKSEPSTLWKRVRKLFGLLPEYEFVYGSRNVQLSSTPAKLYYDANVYAECVKKYNLRNILKPGQVVYGEVYGDGIQANYVYGCKSGEHRLALFDLMEETKYVPPLRFAHFLSVTGLPGVPVLFGGAFSLALTKDLAKGPSALCPLQKIREGVVVKPLEETTCHFGRKVLKVINDDYLLKSDTTEFH